VDVEVGNDYGFCQGRSRGGDMEGGAGKTATGAQYEGRSRMDVRK
jgi:hypothetical protein